ncbi:MAG: YbhB/YbcL family Raf kinase inhibitor-like protein [Thermodesulfobacteriota bacterium]
MKRATLCILLFALVFALSQAGTAVAQAPGKPAAVSVTSPAFQDGSMIPRTYTCDGEDISPPLEISSVPPGTKSLALINDDPDAPGGTWVHWVMYNIPPDTKKLPEQVPRKARLPNGAFHGKTSWGGRKLGYGGPCPPSGIHRYFFKVYALDTVLDLRPGATKDELLSEMKGHILGEGQLMGRYQRRK